MKTYNTVGLVALIVLVVLLPLYGLRESQRMDRAKSALERDYITDATALYLDSCALCHGVDGMGLGAMPPLNQEALAEADRDVLYRTIAYSPHGTTMAAWHVAEGGTMSGYQVESLVTLIKTSAWNQVATTAQIKGLALEPIDVVALADLEPADEMDPHECRSCHEEPVIHAERFGLNCARCHGLEAWKPALLTKHTFALDHGGDQLACQTCHATSYADYTCYGCHDHQPAEMEEVHIAVGAAEFENCALCHPTGEPGEASRLQARTPVSMGVEEPGSGN